MILKEGYSIDDIYIDDNVFTFIKENQALIQENNFKLIYEKASKVKYGIYYNINQLTFVFLSSGINPLNYMSEIPFGFKSYINAIDKLIIPDTINKISWRAINDMYSLKELYIPDSVKTIGDSAFQNCGLVKVSLPNTLEHLDRWIFKGCDYLKEIEYRGTIEQWKALRKNPGWKAQSEIKKIKCIDGDTK